MNIEELINEIEVLLKELKSQVEASNKTTGSSPEICKVAPSGDEDLLFAISCLDDEKKVERGDKIYYIKKYIEDAEYEYGDDIYVINTDGTNDHILISEAEQKRKGGEGLDAATIDDVDDKWVYYATYFGECRKISVRGTMDQEI
ncbi:MAG: hypothetical protein E7265_02705 [Lachnospiraceae bacterium]|nr:hypothetical protein [Lachnospiraceae bacterium]